MLYVIYYQGGIYPLLLLPSQKNPSLKFFFFFTCLGFDSMSSDLQIIHLIFTLLISYFSISKMIS